MNASILIVPMASKKLPGLEEASEVRCDAIWLMFHHVVLDEPWVWYASDDIAVSTLPLPVLGPELPLPAGPEKPRNDRGGATCPPVLLRFRPCVATACALLSGNRGMNGASAASRDCSRLCPHEAAEPESAIMRDEVASLARDDDEWTPLLLGTFELPPREARVFLPLASRMESRMPPRLTLRDRKSVV